MRTDAFFFELPPDRIAQQPPAERGASRLLVLDRRTGSLADTTVGALGGYLRPGDLLVVNDTRVIPARLFAAWDDTGGQLELLLLEETAPGAWEAFHRSRRRLVPGLAFTSRGGTLRGVVEGLGEDGRARVRFAAADVLPRLETEGVPPVPPYIRRRREDAAAAAADRERYQTVYAHAPGAVAAPTAGLHFTPALLAALERQGVGRAAVTLHVGPGTFKPVKTEFVADHTMEAERYVVPAETAARVAAVRAAGGRIVAVGSTTVRTLETVAAEHGEVVAAEGRSALFIRPPYRFRVVDAILTNFHLPGSTLLMMMSAFVGAAAPGGPPLAGRDRLLAAYAEAIRLGYRFYSYGDAMFIHG